MYHEESSGENRPLPYPSPTAVLPDPRMAGRLMYSFYHELDTISTYIYNAIVYETAAPALSALFESLAETEMHHFMLLGRAIRALGANPVIRTGLRVPAVDLPESPTAADLAVATRLTLKNAIRGEQGAIREYLALADLTSDPALAALLRRIAHDEREHVRLLECQC